VLWFSSSTARTSSLRFICCSCWHTTMKCIFYILSTMNGIYPLVNTFIQQIIHLCLTLFKYFSNFLLVFDKFIFLYILISHSYLPLFYIPIPLSDYLFPDTQHLC
jgi:predicted permease